MPRSRSKGTARGGTGGRVIAAAGARMTRTYPPAVASLQAVYPPAAPTAVALLVVARTTVAAMWASIAWLYPQSPGRGAASPRLAPPAPSSGGYLPSNQVARLPEQRKDLPDSPGVYLFRDTRG